jgi:hypothetical protein
MPASDLHRLLGDDLVPRACLHIQTDELIVRVIPLDELLVVSDFGLFCEAHPEVDDSRAAALCAEHDTVWATGDGVPWITRAVRLGESLPRAVADVAAAYSVLKVAVGTPNQNTGTVR